MDTNRQIAIGDIHGCLDALQALLAELRPTSNDHLVFLGDIVDRGPNTKGCIDCLMQLCETVPCVFIMGNHEEMMLDARMSPANLGTWMNFGGDRALASYAKADSGLRIDNIPGSHWAFLQSFSSYYETQKCIFIHGMIRSDLPLDQQDKKDLRWAKFNSPTQHVSKKQVICGHTSQKDGNPLDLGHALCIDTYAHGTGWLTAFETTSEVFTQTNQNKEVRVLERVTKNERLK